jgi:hypothetical protein
MTLQKFNVGDLVEMTMPVEYSLPDHDIGLILEIIESVPNQALRVAFCPDGRELWVAGYRLKKIA